MSEKKSVMTDLNEQEEEKLWEEEEELTELDELTMDIVAVVANNTAASFEKMVHEMNQDSINNISRIIESMSEDNLVDLLKAMFIISDMEYAAETLDVVHVCAGYCDLAYFFFEERLFDTDIMDWYLVESWFDEWERLKASDRREINE